MMLKIKKIIAIILTIALIFALFTENLTFLAATKTIVHVFGTDVNVRASASINSKSLCKIDNDVAELLSNNKNPVDGDWLYIKYNNNGIDVIGYISYNSGWIRLVDYDPDARDPQFEQQISFFPESYHQSLRQLHALYPNWKFTPYTVNASIMDVVALEIPKLAQKPNNKELRKLVSLAGHPVSWRSMGYGSYDWNNNSFTNIEGGWTGASREVVAYYIDPRNFLKPGEIFMFMNQTSAVYDTTKQDVEVIVNKTFMKNGYPTFNGDTYNGSYSEIFLDAGKTASVNPCVLAAVVHQEQGRGTSGLISGTVSGYEGYYNFFNIGATGGTSSTVVSNGLQRAVNEGWSTRAKSIIGGAAFMKNKYINIGQDTYYSQNFNIVDLDNIWHQYAGNISDSYSKGFFLGEPFYSKFNYTLEFKIPIFKDMPNNAYSRPVENDSLNNYYFTEISVNGLTPSFSMFQHSYDLSISNDTIVKVSVPDGASVVSKSEFYLNKGINDVVLTVKSQSGYTNDYIISVNASQNCILYVNTSGNIVNPTYKLGDVNSDGKITISDIGAIKLHLLGRYILTDERQRNAADVNKDGNITISDIGTIKLHLLGRYIITN